MKNLSYDSQGRLILEFPLEKNAKPFYIDFLEGKLAFRKKHRTRQELLIRAIGGPPEKNRIIDATAGIGRDAFIMASFGYSVLMLERSKLLADLLADGLKRLQAATSAFSNFKLLHTDAIDYLKQVPELERPEIIYLDPMFPEREKSALVKKELRIVKELVGEDVDSEVLFATAREIALKRVIVKRPVRANWLDSIKPNFSLMGKACRFDVYLSPQIT